MTAGVAALAAPEAVAGGLAVAGRATATVGRSAWTYATKKGATSVAKAAAGSAGFSVATYGLINKENSTPAGIVSSAAIGGLTGAYGYGLNTTAGLAHTMVPTTTGQIVNWSNKTAIGVALGLTKNDQVNTGGSWWTRPIGGNATSPNNQDTSSQTIEFARE